MSDVKLPEKMSDLLELAVRDLEACEKDPRYEIDMAEWHTPLEDYEHVELFEGTDVACVVCLAGAVLAKTFKAPIDADADVALRWELPRLVVLNAIRCELEWAHGDYSDDPAAFKKAALAHAAELRRKGY